VLRERAVLLNEREKENQMANTFHVALYVKDLEAAVAEYQKILGIAPAKVRPGYAKFELADPPVILSLNVGGEPGKLSHLGIRYPGTGEVASELVRSKAQGLEMIEQKGVTCCYAKADKFWVVDADKVAWEMYTLLADVEAETADQPELRNFLKQQGSESCSGTLASGGCCPSA
jgi:catechol 2,3-dioxygenase-like lactoylglutathione lyase family enzyme